jgi:hypothetical protein
MSQLVQCAVVSFDVKGFSARNTRQQERLKLDLDRILTAAAGAAGLDRDEWKRQPAGDGELAILPASVNLLSLVRRFTGELDTLLTDHNEEHSEQNRIRLRVAMHIGPVTPGGRLGAGGQALIDVSRLLDSRPVRAALTQARAANLALIVSDAVFRQVVVTELDGIRPAQFRKVLVDLPEKKFRQDAYIYIPGYQPVRQPPDPPRYQAGRPLLPPFVLPPEKPPVTGPAKVPADNPPPAGHPAEIESLLTELRGAAGRRDYTAADALTTTILLTAANCGAVGWLRAQHAERLSDLLLTDIDAVWAACSRGRWGFAAQRSVPSAGRPVRFQALAREFGWRSGSGLPPRHAEFTASPPRDLPFLPTLRSPGLEARTRDDKWRELWQRTVEAVHGRLWDWKQD